MTTEPQRTSSAELLRSKVRQLRLLVIAIGCVIGGPVLVFRYFAALPSLEKLVRVSGVVQLDSEAEGGIATAAILVIHGERYEYLDWFPKAENIESLVRGGEQVTIWTDKGANDWVWQIEQDGKIVVFYADIRNAVASNKRMDWLLGGVLFLIGIIAFLKLHQMRKRAAAQRQDAPAAH